MIKEPKLLTVASTLLRPSDAQIAAFQGVPTGQVCDALGGGGALASNIVPISTGSDLDCIAAGPAVTAQNRPGDLLGTLAALSLIQAGDILIGSVSGYQGCGAAGDLVMGMLKNAHGAGFVTDGPVRDYKGIVAVGLPVWCTGLNPASPVTSGPGTAGLPVTIGHQTIHSGDMVVADRDGVVVVPFDKIDQTLAALGAIQSSETAYEAEIAAGRKVSQKALDAFTDGRAEFV
ncbi:RraA family protein [Cognatishimia sp. MH4019]|uniref:RraA family protein n=1 Tax=Cognatishimia sp. MH4019 TaxID=2854030 RepID=UPI001CD81967|nr:RraA family protein [Cognatishimia sp. MH4019]